MSIVSGGGSNPSPTDYGEASDAEDSFVSAPVTPTIAKKVSSKKKPEGLDSDTDPLFSTPCSVCFCAPADDVGTYIKCYRLDCKSIVCDECAPMLLGYSLEAGVIPKCAGAGCNGVYLTDTIRKLGSQAHMDTYMKCIEKGLSATEEDSVRKRQEYDMKLEQIRNERLEFLRREIPKAVVAVAKVAFKKRLAVVANSTKKKLEAALENASPKRRCMNLSCDGFLGENRTCLRCDTVFCERCEEPTSTSIGINGVHVCNEDNVATVNVKKTMGACPKCGIPVEKIAGCRHVTCPGPTCKTKFDYYTGEPTPWHGGEEVKIREQKTKRSLTEIYPGLNVVARSLIQRLEEHEPSTPKPDTMVNAVMAHQKQKNLPLLVGTYCKYTISHYRAVTYVRALTEIERLIKDDLLTIETLQEIVNGWFRLLRPSS